MYKIPPSEKRDLGPIIRFKIDQSDWNSCIRLLGVDVTNNFG